MKRLAYSLIGTSCLCFIGFAAFSKETPYTITVPDYESPREHTALTFPQVILVIAGTYCLLAFPVAGWILSGTSVPKEGVAHRLIMTFVAGLAGFGTAALLIFGTFALREFLFPTPPLPEKD